MNKGIIHDLKSEVRIADARKKHIFEIIDRTAVYCQLSDDNAIVQYLLYWKVVATDKSAWQWLKKYYENELGKLSDNYFKEVDKLATKIDDINQKLKRFRE